MWYNHNIEFYSAIKKMNYDVDESHKNYIAWKKLDIIEYLLYHSIDMKFKNKPNQVILIEVRLVSE